MFETPEKRGKSFVWKIAAQTFTKRIHVDSTVLETLKVERNRLLGEAKKLERAIRVLDPAAFVAVATNGNGHTNGNGSGHGNGAPMWAKTPEGRAKLRAAALKRWAKMSPYLRKKWIDRMNAAKRYR